MMSDLRHLAFDVEQASRNSFLRNGDVVRRSSHLHYFFCEIELCGEENNVTIADVACSMVSSRRETGSP
jgi:hypothetical protein